MLIDIECIKKSNEERTKRSNNNQRNNSEQINKLRFAAERRENMSRVITWVSIMLESLAAWAITILREASKEKE